VEPGVLWHRQLNPSRRCPLRSAQAAASRGGICRPRAHWTPRLLQSCRSPSLWRFPSPSALTPRTVGAPQGCPQPWTGSCVAWGAGCPPPPRQLRPPA